MAVRFISLVFACKSSIIVLPLMSEKYGGKVVMAATVALGHCLQLNSKVFAMSVVFQC